MKHKKVLRANSLPHILTVDVSSKFIDLDYWTTDFSNLSISISVRREQSPLENTNIGWLKISRCCKKFDVIIWSAQNAVIHFTSGHLMS